MTLQQLHYLVKVAQYDSINQAAQSLFVSQSSISKAIQQLESELGFSLLARTRRGVTFTARGLEFLRDTYTLLEQFASMKENYCVGAEPVESISVSSQHYIFVPMAITRIMSEKQNQRYAVTLRELKTSATIEDVYSGRSQIGFISYNSITRNFMQKELEKYGLRFHAFFETQSHVYLADNHPLALESAVSQSQLDPYPYVCYDLDADSSQFAEEVLSPIHPERLLRVTDRSSMLGIIRHTFGYTFGSGLLADSFLNEHVISLPLADSTSIMHIGWITQQTRTPTPGMELLIQYCTEALEQCYTGHRKNATPCDNCFWLH